MKTMTRFAAPFAGWAALAGFSPPEESASAPRHAIGGAFFYSADSDDTEVARAAIDLDIRPVEQGPTFGVRLERAWYNPAGAGAETRDRAFVRAADTRGEWQWRAQLGTDGDSVIGSAALVHDTAFRKELFVERDIVETRQGLDRGIYSTFAGAAVDLPIDERNVVTALAGVQEFTGRNVRTHLRGSYIHVLSPALGLSAQLRGRYFQSSVPDEFDYYSPRWYAELLPVAQVRRFVGGWELVGAAGAGVQRDSESDWRASRYLHARARSPERSNWAANAGFTYTNSPSNSGSAGSDYSYVQFTLGLSRRF